METIKPKSGMTIREIAELAGVSNAAVSAVLNNRWKQIRLTEQTRDKIAAVIKKTRFQPNTAGQALVCRRSFVMGMIVEKIHFSFLPEALEGVEDLTEQKGYGLLKMTTRKDPARQERVLNYLLARNVEGMLLGPGITIPPTFLEILAARDIPVVHMGQSPEGKSFACVDGAQIGYLGMRHLLERGHRHVACWGTSPLIHQGIDRAISESGREVRIAHWLFCDPMESMDQWFDATDRPTAIFVGSDDIASRILHRAIRQGVKIPDELALVGVNDTQAAVEAAIPLTTVSQPKYEQGQAATQLLFDLMEGKPAQSVVLQPHLVVRETT